MILIPPGIVQARYSLRVAPAQGGGEPPADGGNPWLMTANTAFNPTRGQRKLKDGTPFTSTMDDIYDGLFDYWIDGPGQTSAPDSEARIASALANGASYRVGRNAYRQIMPLFFLFRLTGDLRLLDEMTRLGKLAYDNMWRPGHPNADANGWLSGFNVDYQYHGERTWISDLSGYGHDDHLSDTPKAFRTMANVAEALRLNRHHTSPGGWDYGEWADKWKAVFEGYERVWSTVGDGYYPAAAKVETNYRGYANENLTYVRATKLPYHRRGLTHSNISCAALAYYTGKILGKEEEGLDGYDDIMPRFWNEEIYYADPGANEKTLFTRDFKSMVAGNSYAIPVVYSEFVYLEMIDMFLEGNPRGRLLEFDRFMKGSVRAYRDYVLGGAAAPTDNFTVKPDIAGGADKVATKWDGSETITIIDACEGRNGQEFCTVRDKISFGLMSQHILIPWDTEGTFQEYCYQAWRRYSNSGTISEPESPIYPVGLFMKEAGIFN